MLHGELPSAARPRGDLTLTGVAATITVAGIAIIALLVHLDGSVSAVVAALTGHRAAPAATFELAGVAAAITALGVTIIAPLAAA